jgi:hypothetical protein
VCIVGSSDVSFHVEKTFILPSLLPLEKKGGPEGFASAFPGEA